MESPAAFSPTARGPRGTSIELAHNPTVGLAMGSCAMFRLVSYLQARSCQRLIMNQRTGCIVLVLAFCSVGLAQVPTTQKSDQFVIGLDRSGITSLKHANDTFDTDYIQYGRSLGPLLISYRQGQAPWKTQRTTSLNQTLGN